MSRSHLDALNPVLFQLMAELDGYEVQIHALRREWEAGHELVLFGEPGRSMDRMRALAGALPVLSAQWLMVMISHTELMHNLWRVSKGEPLDLAAEFHDHLACVTAMASQCRRLLADGAVFH